MPRTAEEQQKDTPRMEPTDEALASIQDKLNALDSDDAPVLETEEEESQTEEETEESDAGDEPGEESDESTEEPEAEAVEESTGPILPATHRRTLNAYGWDEEEIDRRLRAENPEDFLADALRLHQRRIKETNSWAEAGRRVRDEERQDRPATQASQTQLPGGLQRIDVDALKKEYEGDEMVGGLIDKMTGPVNSVIDALTQMMPQLTEAIQHRQEDEEAATARQMDAFFDSDSMKPYTDLYGPSFEGASEKQFEARFKLMQHADALLVGSERQGQTIPRTDALEFAHEVVSAGFKTTAIRNTIKTAIKTRSKQITLKPTTKAAPQSGGRPNRKELEARVGAALHSMYNK